MKARILVAAIALFVTAGAVFVSVDHADANHVTSRSHGSWNWWSTPDGFYLNYELSGTSVANVHPDALYPTLDGMKVTTFWNWFNWFGGRWMSGGVYDSRGCLECTTVTSPTNNEVWVYAGGAPDCRLGTAHHRYDDHFGQPPITIATITESICG